MITQLPALWNVYWVDLCDENNVKALGTITNTAKQQVGAWMTLVCFWAIMASKFETRKRRVRQRCLVCNVNVPQAFSWPVWSRQYIIVEYSILSREVQLKGKTTDWTTDLFRLTGPIIPQYRPLPIYRQSIPIWLSSVFSTVTPSLFDGKFTILPLFAASLKHFHDN